VVGDREIRHVRILQAGARRLTEAIAGRDYTIRRR
jgi:hypothetical protein